ncbi:hypothetical protein EX895_005365 [Sporisorium graminicola]|uniref:Uncharacterized protein n=1 Tax=Sporisorium graminicola TaxID=280036 RepID=A0A4U7KNI4_9BASI|nr:hypothetical protein EX895_005365 [Sporisorium graminicola]TKY85824.1 hypothetical protein EX895_005365 [Sporisorium graminicola]
MQRTDEEARPLLGDARSNVSHDAASISSDAPATWKANASRRLRRHWPILRVLTVTLLWGMANYGAVPSYLDGLRSYTCSYVYSTHPSLLPTEPHPKLPRDRDRPCAISGVESRVGIVVAIATLLSFVVSSISMLYYGPRLSRWGRKPMLLISLVSNMINYIPFALLPLGYPFGDIPSELSISPATSMVIILFCSFVTGLTGFTGLFLCVVRVMIVDVAPPTRRTIALNWLVSAMMCGAFLGPLLAAWALDTSVKAHKRRDFERLFDTSHTSLELPSEPTAPPIPGTPQSPSKHGNPAALVACCWVFFLAIVWVSLLVPETKPVTVGNAAGPNQTATDAPQENDVDVQHDAEQSSMSPSRLRIHKMLGPLAIYLPQVTREGRKDYRLTWLALAGAIANIGSNALSYIAVFAGYKFDFTPDAIGLLLGLIGATRAAWLLFAIPLLVLFFERTIRKSSRIASLSASELEALAKAGLKDPNLKQADRRQAQDLGDQGLAQPLETDATTDALSEETTMELVSAVVLWRTAVDLAITRVSYFADIVGYLVVFVSASFSNAAAMIFARSQ